MTGIAEARQVPPGSVSRTGRRAEEQLLKSREYGEVEEMAQTVLERMKAKERRAGRQEGRQEGREEGRQEGRQEALQEALTAIVRNRFPAAAEEYEARIRQVVTNLLSNALQHTAEQHQIGRGGTAVSAEGAARASGQGSRERKVRTTPSAIPDTSTAGRAHRLPHR